MPKLSARELNEKTRNIELIVMDVDGVLTDGRIIYSSDGIETKSFNVRDGYGLAVARLKGLNIAWVSGRSSEVTTLRAEELGIEHVYQGIHEKDVVIKELSDKLQIDMQSIVFIGDDVIDIPAMEAAGVGVAVADAHPDALTAADWVTSCKGGHGAVRELIDLILKAMS